MSEYYINYPLDAALILNTNNLFEKMYVRLMAPLVDRVTTRGSEKILTKSCRGWLCFLILICKFNIETSGKLFEAFVSPTNSEEQHLLISECQLRLYNIFLILYKYDIRRRTSIFYDIYNGNLTEETKPYITPLYSLPEEMLQRELGDHICLCVYNISTSEGSIDHFFNIYYFNGEYYLNSAYGGDIICIPQYTTLLNLDDLNQLCYRIQDLSNEENFNFFSAFYDKYFLNNTKYKALYLSKNAIDENPQLSIKFPDTLSPEKSKRVLIDEYKNNTNMRIGWIKDYNELLDEYIKYISGGRKTHHNTHKSKRHKNKSKRNKNKSKINKNKSKRSKNNKSKRSKNNKSKRNRNKSHLRY